MKEPAGRPQSILPAVARHGGPNFVEASGPKRGLCTVIDGAAPADRRLGRPELLILMTVGMVLRSGGQLRFGTYGEHEFSHVASRRRIRQAVKRLIDCGYLEVAASAATDGRRVDYYRRTDRDHALRVFSERVGA